MGKVFALMYLDFDYLIVSNQDFEIASLQNTISFFSELGIRKFIFTVDVDYNLRSLTQIRERIKSLQQRLHSLKPRSTFLSVSPNLLLSDGLLRNPSVSRLAWRDSRFLFLQMPLFSDEDWILYDINHLIFKQKLLPIFCTFDANIRTNPTEWIDRCLDAHFLYFSLDLNYITSIDAQTRLSQIIDRNIPIFPAISHTLPNYAGVLKAFSLLRDRIGSQRYIQMCRTFQQNSRSIFKHLR